MKRLFSVVFAFLFLLASSLVFAAPQASALSTDKPTTWAVTFSHIAPNAPNVTEAYCLSHTPDTVVGTVNEFKQGLAALNGVKIQYLTYDSSQRGGLYFNNVKATVSGKDAEGAWSYPMTLHEQTLSEQGKTWTVWQTPKCKGVFVGEPVPISPTDPGWALGLSLGIVFITLAIGITYLVFYILMLVAMYQAIEKLPQQHRIFPAWFVWMTLIPFAGYVFRWMMLPFGLPKAAQKYLPENKTAKSLFGLGLAYLIVGLAMLPLVLIPFGGPIIAYVTQFILMIIYWRKTVRLNKELDAVENKQSN